MGIERRHFLKTPEKKRFELNTAKSACNNWKFPFFDFKPLKTHFYFENFLEKRGGTPPLDITPPPLRPLQNNILPPPPSKSENCASEKSCSILPITHFKLKIKKDALAFLKKVSVSWQGKTKGQCIEVAWKFNV